MGAGFGDFLRTVALFQVLEARLGGLLCGFRLMQPGDGLALVERGQQFARLDAAALIHRPFVEDAGHAEGDCDFGGIHRARSEHRAVIRPRVPGRKLPQHGGADACGENADDYDLFIHSLAPC